MILKDWVRHIMEGNVYQGLEIFEKDNLISYSFLRVTQKNGELLISVENTFEKVDELAKLITKKAPLLLAVNTSKVLKKQVDTDTKGNTESWVSQAFPNLELDNFYYQILDSLLFKMVAISKKEHIDQLLKTLEEHHIEPTSVSLGITNLENIIPYLKGFPILGSNFELRKENNHELQFKATDSFEKVPVEINGLVLSNTSLLPFSNILGYLGKDHKESNLILINGQSENRFKNNRFFDFGLKIGLGSILALLLLNFLAFSHYRKKTQAMETVSSLEQQSITLNTIRKRVSEKESRLKMLLSSSNSRTTFYLDRIAHEIPNNIQLDEMAYQPLIRPISEKKSIEVLKNSILISGKTNNKVAFSQWTDLIEHKNWVGKVEILGYEYVSKISDKFTLKIQLNEVDQ